jgi:peptide/nickel transport system substrate-binding protein
LSPGHEPEEDPKAVWHTESDNPNGLNRMRFSHPRADALIDELRLNTNENERKKLFLELQEILYDEQPVIFLFAPLERLAFHRRFEADASAIRPGYRLGAFQIMEELVAQ